MKKLGIFLFNNQNYLVERYIQFLLDDITLNLDHLCVILNNDTNGIKFFEKYTNDIFINKNDYDLNIWKNVIINYLGFDYLEKFEEVILFDDSFFGPVYSFKEIFNFIDDVNLDFWTILSNGIDDELNSSNLQFIAFRKNIIVSDYFKDFWKNIKASSLKNKNNENYMINHFSKLEFVWKNYLDICNTELNEKIPFFGIFDINNLITNYKLPLINIKPFMLPKKVHLNYHNGLDLSLTMNYLNKKTSYNVSLIYNYLLKIIDPNELVNLLNLKRVVSLENLNNNYKSDKTIVVIAHLYYEDLLSYDFKFLSNVPDYIDIVITTDSIEKKNIIEKKFLSKLNNYSKVIVVNSRGRDMSGLLVGCKEIIYDYDYFCFVHDKKSSYNEYYLNGNSFRDIIWENMLASEDYINTILKFFDDNDSLGLIVPPRVYHSTYFTAFYHNYWLANIDEINKLFYKMNINSELKLDELPLSIGNCYWAKVDALKPLFDLNWNYEDFHSEPLPHDGTVSHALERIYAHIVANQGFYTEIVMTDNYGSNELTNYPYMFSQVLMIIQNHFDKKLKYFSTFEEILSRFKNNLYNLDENIRIKDKKINEIVNSNSWKITKPLRTFRLKLTTLKKK